jgi:multisubunit Na+/H+ antiporter MnhF subunit
MPLVTRWFLKTALLYMGATFFLAIAWLRVIGAPAVPDRAIVAGQPSTRSPVDTPSR